METKDVYRSKNGRFLFFFTFSKPNGSNHWGVCCTNHPGFNGKDSDPEKTHIFSNNQLCFQVGSEPGSLRRARELAAQWSEYIVDYRRTGVAQS